MGVKGTKWSEEAKLRNRGKSWTPNQRAAFVSWNRGKSGLQVAWNKGRKSPTARCSSAKGRAAKKGKDWLLTTEQYTSLILNPCHYCGGELPKYGTGLDRKDSSQGYSIDNVVPCCTVCNDTKGAHLSYDEMLWLMSYRRFKTCP